jgi:hypothetical protein
LANVRKHYRSPVTSLVGHPLHGCRESKLGDFAGIPIPQLSNYSKQNTMSFDNVSPGKNAPEAFNVVIEIPMNADPIKYEVDKESGALFVDRFMTTAMHYPDQLRLCAADPERRRRSGRRAGDHAVPAAARRGGHLPPDRHPDDGRRSRRRRQGAGRAHRQESCPSTPTGRRSTT